MNILFIFNSEWSFKLLDWRQAVNDLQCVQCQVPQPVGPAGLLIPSYTVAWVSDGSSQVTVLCIDFMQQVGNPPISPLCRLHLSKVNMSSLEEGGRISCSRSLKLLKWLLRRRNPANAPKWLSLVSSKWLQHNQPSPQRPVIGIYKPWQYRKVKIFAKL